MNLRTRAQGSLASAPGLIVAAGISTVAADPIKFGIGRPLTGGLPPIGTTVREKFR